MSDEARFPGWRVVTGGFIVIATASGLGFYGLAVYLNAFSRERGWDIASISLATTVFFVVGGGTGMVVARVINRYDVRAVMVVGGVLGAAALMSLGQVTTRWQMYAAYVVFGVGHACTSLVPVTTVVTRWFHTRRAVALSIASTGLSAGGVLLTPAAKWLLDHRGIDGGMPILAVAYVVGTVPFALWLVRPDPAALGWLPDGERVTADTGPVVLTGTPFAEAVCSRFFVCVTAAYVLILGAQVGGLQQVVKLAEERTDAETAALATLVVAIASIIARLIGGRIVEYLPMVAFTAALAVTQALATAWLAGAHRAAVLFPGLALFGVTIGNILMLQPLLISARFGVLDYPRLYSRSQFVGTLGIAGGPYVLGLLHDHAGGYTTAYLVASAAAVVGAAILLVGGPATPDHLPTAAVPAVTSDQHR